MFRFEPNQADSKHALSQLENAVNSGSFVVELTFFEIELGQRLNSYYLVRRPN